MFTRSASITFSTCVILTVATSAEAALLDRGGGLIYDSDLDITWLANANLGAGSSFDDGVLATDGAMTWQSAMNWVAALEYYDTVRAVTYDDWRLPATAQPDPTCSQQQGGGAFSTGANCTGSELGHMFYTELGGVAYYPVSYSGDPDLALFMNLQSDGYWSEREFDATFAFVLNYEYGLQGSDNKSLGYFAWAVRDGDVAEIPAPPAAWLLATGLVALARHARRRAG
jgi:hypothetical protein